jgi:hypothetical protein
MILNNDVVNHLIRQGKSRRTFSGSLDLTHYLDQHGQVMPDRQRMPLLDALDSLISAAQALHPDDVHPQNLVGIELPTDIVKSVVVSLCRVEPMQGDLLDPAPKSFQRQVDEEVKDAIGAHKSAETILKKIPVQDDQGYEAGNRTRPKDLLSMDTYVQLVNASPNPEFTKTLLADAGPDGTQWFSPHGVLAALKTPMAAALVASKTVEVEVNVLYVREKLGLAMVEIVGYKNAYSESMLCHHNAEVELKFDSDQIERDDLVLIQYRKDTVVIRANAMCGTHRKTAKKTVLTLAKLLVSREEMNKLHAAAHQLRLPFSDEGNLSESC